MKKLTKKEVDAIFITEIMPIIRLQEQAYQGTSRTYKDTPLRSESYNNFVDGLCRDKQITSSKAETYCIPSYLVA